MFDDDDAVRRALQSLADDPMPLVTTTFDEVLRRGRRRVFVQRLSAAVGVMGVVAAIGVGAVLLRPSDQSGGVRVGGTASESRSVPATPLIPGGTDWGPVEMPAANDPASGCVQTDPLPPEREVALLPEGFVKEAFSVAVEETIGNHSWKINSQWEEHSLPHGGNPRGYVLVTAPTADDTANFQLEAGRFGGTPTAFADWSRRAYNNCEPPWRRVLDDGTVLQLFPVDYSKHSKQGPKLHLEIYRPDGREYIISSVVDNSRQLGDVAERLIANLG